MEVRNHASTGGGGIGASFFSSYFIVFSSDCLVPSRYEANVKLGKWVEVSSVEFLVSYITHLYLVNGTNHLNHCAVYRPNDTSIPSYRGQLRLKEIEVPQMSRRVMKTWKRLRSFLSIAPMPVLPQPRFGHLIPV